MSTPRAVLLVGEGNFSYSAALCQSWCSESAYITATCLQSQEEALQHEGAANNIKIIRDAGGLVVFEVDCTRLRECPSLQGLDFDSVIFNFPHCGRKSGVKKNRELLKNFFLSCVQVLSKDGEVHVALCNGQGGTPADQPMREWHNSWQVVAMATEAGLILTRVEPFDTEMVESYQCTGYRSQDKGFHVEKALLHVFTRSLPYSSAENVQIEEIVEGERVHYYIPAELRDYILRDFLSPSSAHPVRLVQDLLLTGLADEWLVSMMTKPLPLLLTAKQLHTCCYDIDDEHCYWIQDCLRLPLDVPTSTEPQPEMEKLDQSVLFNDGKHTETSETLLGTSSDKGGSSKHQGAENLRTNCCLNINFEGESGLVLLNNHQPSNTSKTLSDTSVTSDAGHASEHQESENLSTCRCLHMDSEGESCFFPSLVPQMKELLTRKPYNRQPEELLGVPGSHRDREEDHDIVKVEDLDSEGERGVFLLRPSLCPQMQELLPQQAQKGRRQEALGLPGVERESKEKSDSWNIVLEGCAETEWNRDIIKGEGNGISDGFREGNRGGNKTVDTCEKLLCVTSGLVFRNLPIAPWSPPVFHQLLLMGTFPAACEPIPVLVRSLGALLTPFGVSLAWEQGCLCLTAEPMGLVGKVWTGAFDGNISRVSITVLLNLDLLAVLMYSLPDWRLLWSRDPRFLKECLLLPHPSPEKPFQPFSLYPQKFSFDISFWTSTRPSWDEMRFHSLVREASHGTVEQVTLIDTFSHPDFSQTSYCYRLVYRSHTHALSHTQALRLHTRLQDLLSARLKVTIR